MKCKNYTLAIIVLLHLKLSSAEKQHVIYTPFVVLSINEADRSEITGNFGILLYR